MDLKDAARIYVELCLFTSSQSPTQWSPLTIWREVTLHGVWWQARSYCTWTHPAFQYFSNLGKVTNLRFVHTISNMQSPGHSNLGQYRNQLGAHTMSMSMFYDNKRHCCFTIPVFFQSIQLWTDVGLKTLDTRNRFRFNFLD